MLLSRSRTSAISAAFAVAVAGLGLPSTAQSAAVFSSKASFLAATGPLSFESFESLTANNDNSLSTVTVADFTVGVSNSSLAVRNAPISGSHATDGVQYLEFLEPPPAVTFTFNVPTNALGLFFIDLEIGSNTNAVSFLTSSGESGSGVLGPLGDASEAYLGFIASSAFTSVTFTVSDGTFVAVDSVSYGAVPEPGTLAILGLGLAGLAASRRRKQ